jgi:hypothetical protein
LEQFGKVHVVLIFMLRVPFQVVSHVICKWKSVCAAACLVAGLSHVCQCLAVDGGDTSSDHPDRVLRLLGERRAICGIHCLYVVAKMQRDDVAIEDVERLVRVHADGNSLLELQTAAHQLGLNLQMGRRLPAEWQWRLPAIVHVRFGKPGDASRNEHYLVMLKADANGAVCIDGTDGEIRHVTRRRMEELMTGYVLEPVGADWIRRTFWILPLLVAGVVILFAFHGRGVSGRPTRDSPQKDLNSKDVQELAFHSGSDIWRSPDRDAVNSLYMLLALPNPDIAIPYECIVAEFIAETAPHSLASLRNVASRLGREVQAIHVRDWEKAVSIVPAVVHLEDPRAGGRFVLVYQISKDVLFVDSGLAVVRRMGIDEFRLKWSGHACILADVGDAPTSSRIAGVVQWSAIVSLLYITTRFASMKTVSKYWRDRSFNR